jgi:pimeloyl-ACP methyl ester carboxylesterase
VRLATYDFGGDGPPLLFVHATGFHAHVWLPVVEELRDRFHCFGIDQRAHGDSEAPAPDGYNWQGLGADVLSALDTLGLDRPFGAGHSSGAAALILAEESQPGTFAALWAYEPIVVPVEDPIPTSDNPMAEGARRRREVFADRDAAYANYASKPPFDALAPTALRAYVDYGFDDLADGTVRLKCRGANEARFYETQGGHTAYRDLDRVHCPVTLVSGVTGGFPATFVGPIAERLQDARVEQLDGAGHFGPLEQPSAVAASIARAFTPS